MDAATRTSDGLRKSLRELEDRTSADARALEQACDAKVHEAEQALAAKTMEFERELGTQKASADTRLRKVLENVQRVKDTTRAQQASQQKLLEEAQGQLQQRLADQQHSHERALDDLRRM